MAMMCQKLNIFSTFLRHFVRCNDDLVGFGVKNLKNQHIFVSGGKKIEFFGQNVYPCHNLSHHQILASDFIYTSLLILHCGVPDSPDRFPFSTFSKTLFPQHCTIHLHFLRYSPFGLWVVRGKQDTSRRQVTSKSLGGEIYEFQGKYYFSLTSAQRSFFSKH